jgi:hypothetical protein
VLFTDESRFWLLHIDGRVRVWRRPGERHLDETLEEKVPFGGGSIMVWSEIIFNGRTELVVIREGSMTARRYIDEVLEPHVVPFAQNMGPEFILQQDNACPHIARVVLEVTLLEEECLLLQPKCDLLVGGQDHAYSDRNDRNYEDAAQCLQRFVHWEVSFEVTSHGRFECPGAWP